MKKMIKRIVNTILSILVVLISLLGSTTTSHAAENTFIPFRSDYAKYISLNSTNSDKVIQYVWLRLFDEETHWSSGKSYYSSGFSKWADKYYSNYTASNGVTKSSKGVTITYNSAFDSFLYGTINSNPDFVINWINQNPAVFTQYCKQSNSHPSFAKGIVKLTSSGKYLGSGRNAANNTFLRGANSIASDKLNAAWRGTNTTSTTHDIDILRALGSQWKTLNTTQKNWIKTYINWLVDDYITNRTNGVASLNNSKDLYQLIATSGYGFTRSEVNQSFFDYCLSDSDTYIGDLIVNAADYYRKTGELRSGTTDMAKNFDMSIIWELSDADCDYSSSWNGGKGSGFGDNDYDWFCYNICFNNEHYYQTLRTLISHNPTTYQQMQDWLFRFNVHNDTSANNNDTQSVAYAVAHAGQTVSTNLSSYTQPGCNSVSKHGKGFQHGAHWGQTEATVMKPVGVKGVTFSHNTGYAQETWYSYKITSLSDGQVLSSGDNVRNVDYTFPAKYTWSNDIQIWVKVRTRTGAPNGSYESVGAGGSCFAQQNRVLSANWEYTDLSVCEKSGHQYQYSYSWNSDHSICTANGVCANCGKHTTPIKSVSTKTQDTNYIYYTASFAHTNIGAKTYTVPKLSGTVTFTSSSPEITGQTSNSSNKSKKNTGEGFDLSTSTSATCSLKSGAIKIGAKSIRVSTKGNRNNITLYDKNSVVMDSVTVSNGDYVFNLADYSDSSIDGMYIVINMYDQSIASGGYYIGQNVSVTAKVQFNSIKITY